MDAADAMEKRANEDLQFAIYWQKTAAHAARQARKYRDNANDLLNNAKAIRKIEWAGLE